MMKIDIFAHVLPKKFTEGVRKKAKKVPDANRMPFWQGGKIAAIEEIDIRLRVMDRYPDVVQVLSTPLMPPLERLLSPGDAVELAKVANDEMAEMVAKYPDKFLAAVASLPLSDIDASLREAERAITQLQFRGVQIYSNLNGETLDTPKLRPLYEMMAHHDLPIWIHPYFDPVWWEGTSDFHSLLGWPYQTSVAMISLARGGIFKDFPNIKFITHHCGGMVPFFEKRIRFEIDDLRKFYNDTAVGGSTAALMCGYAFFGPDHLLFGTDMPFGKYSNNRGLTLDIIESIERMEVPETVKKKIFKENALRLLKLAV